MKTNKPYRFNVRTGRNIEVIFSIMPNKRISTGTRDMVEAIKFADHYLAMLGQEIEEVPLFKDFAKDFFIREDKESLRYRHKQFRRENREGWYKRNQWYLDKYIMPHFAHFPLNTITQVMIENWMVSMKGLTKKDLSGNSIKKTLQALREILDDAVRYSYIKTNPARGVLIPADIKVFERRPLSLSEQRILFPNDKKERLKVWETILYATYFSVMYDTGFRPAEVQGLRVCDVYTTPQGLGVFTSHTICSEEHKAKNRVKTSGKGMESRVGLLTTVTADLLLKMIKDAHLKDDDYLFLSDRAKKDSWIKGATANKKLRNTCNKYGLESDITQYCLRHTYATFRRGNMDEATLALSMGHSGGRVRNDYDHRTASILLAQLEKSRDAIFSEDDKEEEIKPLKEKRG